MNRCLRVLAFAAAMPALTALGPRAASAQADWTFEIPLSVTKVPTGVDMGAVVCIVSVSDYSGAQASRRAFAISSGEVSGYQPGDPVVEWNAVRPPDDRFVGFQYFEIGTDGSGPSSVTVEVAAPEGTSESAKSSARNWACALAFRGTRPNGYAEWDTPDPDQLAFEDLAEVVTPSPGTAPTLWVSGTIGN